MVSNYKYDYVKEQVDGFEYISRFTSQLKKVGEVYRGLCPFPFHNEKTGSFTVYPVGFNDPKEGPQEHASFYCFGCGNGGDVIQFKKLMEDFDSRYQALKALAAEFEIDIEDKEVQQNHMKDQLEKMKQPKQQILTLQEINMVCSSICRNYLTWVKENYPEIYKAESEIIDKFYLYFDRAFDEKSALDCMDLIEEVNQKILKRRQKLKGNE
jgi:hypothetical protein